MIKTIKLSLTPHSRKDEDLTAYDDAFRDWRTFQLPKKRINAKNKDHWIDGICCIPAGQSKLPEQPNEEQTNSRQKKANRNKRSYQDNDRIGKTKLKQQRLCPLA